MNPTEKPWTNRGQARAWKSIVVVTSVMSHSATACRRQPPTSMRRWSMRDTRRPDTISAIIVPSPPGASVSPAVQAS